VPASFFPGWLEGGVDSHLLLPGCLEDGGALSLPRCEDDDWAWGGAELRCEGGRGRLPFPCVPGGGRDRPRPQSCVREFRAQFAQVVFVHLGVGLRDHVFAPFCSNRSCCCRDRGCRMCRGCRGCRVGGLSTRAPLLSAGLPAPPPGGLVGFSSCSIFSDTVRLSSLSLSLVMDM
jgi:hypothetical protein